MARNWAQRRQQVLRSAFTEDFTRTNETTLPVRASPRKKSNTTPIPFDPATAEQRRYSVAWHAFTQAFSLPPTIHSDDGPIVHDELPDAVTVVMNPKREVPRAGKTNNAVAWFFREMYGHYAGTVKPAVDELRTAYGGTERFVMETVGLLQAAADMYHARLNWFAEYAENAATGWALRGELERKVTGLFGNSQPESMYLGLKTVLLAYTRGMFLSASGSNPSEVHERFMHLVNCLQSVSLTGKRFESIVSGVLNQVMEEYITAAHGDILTQQDCQAVDTTLLGSPGVTTTQTITAIFAWVEDVFAQVAIDVMDKIGIQGTKLHVATWKGNALRILAHLRTGQLYDIVLHWPNSRGGLLDLKACVTTTAQRTHLTSTFSRDLEKQLLHPGSSTLHILKVYIAMIRTFHALDNSKVLLARVVPSLQLYLCQRLDAIRIVVTGLLSDTEDTNSEASRRNLTELAHILNSVSQAKKLVAEDDDHDWNDMNWNPAPIDAAINFKRPKTEDVIGTLITALGSQDMFIKEFQIIVAERLLSTRSNLQQEAKVLNLLKKRYGDAALQNCDVMMRDITESTQIDERVRATIYAYAVPNRPEPPMCSARILSRLYWPNIDREHFLIPESVTAAQKRYATTYAQIKESRLLTWLDHMGKAQVELETEDRSIKVICKTYVATVIYAFGDEGQEGAEPREGPVKLTVDDLKMKLQMDTDYIEEAIAFWIEKQVLRQVEDGVYAVIERMDSVETQADAPAEGTVGALAPVTAAGGQKVAKDEKKPVYWQFIKGMLTNSSMAMPLKRMATMLKSFVPGGFTWTNEELMEFLQEKVESGEVEVKGGKYKLKKKK